MNHVPAPVTEVAVAILEAGAGDLWENHGFTRIYLKASLAYRLVEEYGMATTDDPRLMNNMLRRGKVWFDVSTGRWNFKAPESTGHETRDAVQAWMLAAKKRFGAGYSDNQ